MLFDQIVKQLTTNPHCSCSIHRRTKTIKGMSRFTSKNAYGDEYIKISFTDKSALLLIIPTQEIFYSTKPLGELTAATDNDIGNKIEIIYQHTTLKLVNKNDYQYCLQHYIGKPGIDIEGECRFSDYMSPDGNHILSLGWLSDTGKRADVYAAKIKPEDVVIM